MLAAVNNYTLLLNGCVIDCDLFRFLTGKNINWETRNGKRVELERIHGHLIVRDYTFLIGERYKKDSTIFLCIAKASDGNYVLASVDPDNQDVRSSTNSLEWEIV